MLPTGEDYKGLRALLFSLLGLTALAPILHFSLSPGLPIDDEAFWAFLCRMFSMGGCYLVGAALYGASLPERVCVWSKSVDMYRMLPKLNQKKKKRH